MRPSWVCAVLASAVVVSGCGPESSGENRPPNPAASVFKTFDTFSIEDQEGLPEVLPNTVFYDFYQALEPADGEDDQNTAAAIRERLNALMGLTPSGDGSTYTAARNPIDFLNFVINSNQVGNFNEGRQLMRNVIADGVPALYNSRPINGTTIQFTETGGESDSVWVYPLLDWRNNPAPGTVVSSRQFVARTPDDESGPEPEVASMLWSARFDDSGFAVSGYNQPDFEVLSITSRTLGEVDLQKEYIGRNVDTFFINNPSSVLETDDGQRCENVPPDNPLGINIADEDPDCIRVEVDYGGSQVRVFTSRDEAPFTEDCQAFNANYCGNKSIKNGGATVIYDSVTINSRQ